MRQLGRGAGLERALKVRWSHFVLPVSDLQRPGVRGSYSEGVVGPRFDFEGYAWKPHLDMERAPFPQGCRCSRPQQVISFAGRRQVSCFGAEADGILLPAPRGFCGVGGLPLGRLLSDHPHTMRKSPWESAWVGNSSAQRRPQAGDRRHEGSDEKLERYSGPKVVRKHRKVECRVERHLVRRTRE